MSPNASAAPRITTGGLPASSKIHLSGTLHDLRVPMRQIHLDGEPPLNVYDSSGPYTDPALLDTLDIARGLPPVRGAWQRLRGDAEAYAGRVVVPADNGFADGVPA
ncbi:MAG TPA: hypothetical protein DDZ67_13350 [Xanthomonadaceae bacterium]|nr:hypothetical protein [Xanthomonadaceae bacterium]